MRKGIQNDGSLEMFFLFSEVGPLSVYNDSLDEGMPLSQGKMIQDPAAPLERMADPSQMLRDAVVNLINYQVCNLNIL